MVVIIYDAIIIHKTRSIIDNNDVRRDPPAGIPIHIAGVVIDADVAAAVHTARNAIVADFRRAKVYLLLGVKYIPAGTPTHFVIDAGGTIRDHITPNVATAA